MRPNQVRPLEVRCACFLGEGHCGQDDPHRGLLGLTTFGLWYCETTVELWASNDD